MTAGSTSEVLPAEAQQDRLMEADNSPPSHALADAIGSGTHWDATWDYWAVESAPWAKQDAPIYSHH
jgi:hypothetical protein